MRLYYAPGTCALAVIIVLEEIGASYELRSVDFAAAEQQTPEFRALNPQGRVPVLVTEQGCLTETPALLVYLAQRFPAAWLIPQGDTFAFAQLQAFNAYLCSTVHVAHAHRMRGHRWADDPAAIEAMRRKVPESVGACFDLIERHLLGSPWAMGAAYSVADAYLYTLASWLEADGVDVERCPRVLEHRRRMAERPAVRRARDREAGGGKMVQPR
jgi:glutathione S-transferase